MVISPCVQTGQVPHPAARVVQGDCCPGVPATSEDHLVTQGNAVGKPCQIFQVESSPRAVAVTGDCLCIIPAHDDQAVVLAHSLDAGVLSPLGRLRGSVTQPPCWTLHCTQLLRVYSPPHSIFPD